MDPSVVAAIALMQSKPVELRRTVGGKVHALACQVSNDAECKRLFGSQYKTKKINGIVERVELRQATSKSTRRSTYITAKYNLTSKPQKTKELFISNVSNGWLPEPNPAQEEDTNTTPTPQDTATAANTTTTTTLVEQLERANDITAPSILPQTPAVAPPAVAPPAEAAAGVTAPPPTVQQPMPPTERTPRGGEAVVTVHDFTWTQTDGQATLNGNVHQKEWSILTPLGERIGPSNKEQARDWSRMHTFLQAFPALHVRQIIRLTNSELRRFNQDPMTTQELFKFFGVLILITRFEYQSRASLWSTTAKFKFIPAPSLGMHTGMSRTRFDYIFRCLTFSHQEKVRPLNMRHED